MGAFSAESAPAVHPVRQALAYRLALALALCALAGCAGGRGGSCLAVHETSSTQAAAELPLATGPPPPLTADVSGLGSLADLDRELPRPAPPDSHRPLSAREAQCRAAAHAPLAELLVLEARLAASGARSTSAWAAQLESELLLLRAIEERNKAAAGSLEAFHRLAQAQNDRRLVEQSRTELDRSRQQVEELRKQGLKVPIDVSALDRRRFDSDRQSAELELSQRMFEGQLRQLMGVAAEDTASLWPQADWQVTTEAIDVAEAIAVGLRTRADLAILARLSETLDSETLNVARTGLRQTDSALGIPPMPTPTGLFRRSTDSGDTAGEVAVRRQQLALLNAQKTREASDEIRLAAATLETRLRQIVVARDLLENRRRRTSDLSAQKATGAASAFDVNLARLEERAAESELVERITAWRLAETKLRAAQGLLAEECGYGLESARSASACH
ncbi:MAG: hypothetical protein WD176_09315 [Pirellulales bacterium]